MEEKIKIIFEDSEMIVVDKAAGITTTKEKKGEEGTLEDFLIKTRSNNLPRNGIVHRLDKGTSGLILVAKTENAFNKLKNQFKNRKVIKKYISLIGGDSSIDGRVEMPIGRSKYSFGKFAVVLDGKNAITEFKTIKKYKVDNKFFSLLEINLKTGRTHQIRVHMNYLGWPLVGDKVYGGDISILNRPFLHAAFIKIVHPKSKKIVSFNSDLPKDLKEVLNFYEKK